MKKDFYYPSRDGTTTIHGVEWKPEGEVKAVLQICHGMVEYIARYDAFASYLAEQGYYVVGNDHLGHGDSVNSEEEYGHFPVMKGNHYVVGDIQKLRGLTAKKYPDVPYFMLGHSMGSFLLRQYLFSYGRGLAGAIIMGTGYKGATILTLGQMVCKLVAKIKGWDYRSDMVNNLGIGGYNKKFEPSDSTKDWVTSDAQMRQLYENDPLCNFVFTVSGYYQMFTGMKTLTKKENMKRMSKTLPLLLVSGADDPVGDFGKGVKKVYRQYKENGCEDVKIKLYPEDRHEIINETDREKVFEDIYNWLEQKRNKTGKKTR